MLLSTIQLPRYDCLYICRFKPIQSKPGTFEMLTIIQGQNQNANAWNINNYLNLVLGQLIPTQDFTNMGYRIYKSSNVVPVTQIIGQDQKVRVGNVILKVAKNQRLEVDHLDGYIFQNPGQPGNKLSNFVLKELQVFSYSLCILVKSI